MSDLELPRCIEITVSQSSGGKVSIESYDWSSNWMVSMARKYEIPEGWSDDDVEAFQYTQYQALYDVVDAIDNEESEKRRKASGVASVRLTDDD